MVRVLKFLKGTRDDILTLDADNTQTLTWYIDAVFVVHLDIKIHTGMVFTFENKEIICSSTKQKVNARSSTEAELVASDDKLSRIICTNKFMEHKYFKVKLNLIFQDNTNTMKLQNNGKLSSGERTKHFEIK